MPGLLVRIWTTHPSLKQNVNTMTLLCGDCPRIDVQQERSATLVLEYDRSCLTVDRQGSEIDFLYVSFECGVDFDVVDLQRPKVVSGCFGGM